MKPWATSCGATGRFFEGAVRRSSRICCRTSDSPRPLAPPSVKPAAAPTAAPLPGGRSHVLPCYDSDRRTDDCAGRAGQKASLYGLRHNLPKLGLPGESVIGHSLIEDRPEVGLLIDKECFIRQDFQRMAALVVENNLDGENSCAADVETEGRGRLLVIVPPWRQWPWSATAVAFG